MSSEYKAKRRREKQEQFDREQEARARAEAARSERAPYMKILESEVSDDIKEVLHNLLERIEKLESSREANGGDPGAAELVASRLGWKRGEEPPRTE